MEFFLANISGLIYFLQKKKKREIISSYSYRSIFLIPTF